MSQFLTARKIKRGFSKGSIDLRRVHRFSGVCLDSIIRHHQQRFLIPSGHDGWIDERGEGSWCRGRPSFVIGLSDWDAFCMGREYKKGGFKRESRESASIYIYCCCCCWCSDGIKEKRKEKKRLESAIFVECSSCPPFYRPPIFHKHKRSVSTLKEFMAYAVCLAVCLCLHRCASRSQTFSIQLCSSFFCCCCPALIFIVHFLCVCIFFKKKKKKKEE